MTTEKQLDDINFLINVQDKKINVCSFELHNFNNSSFNILGRKIGVRIHQTLLRYRGHVSAYPGEAAHRLAICGVA